MYRIFARINFLRALIQPDARSFIGLDITPTSVRMLEICAKEAGVCVQRYAQAALPAHVFDGSMIKDMDAVAQTIKNLYSQLKTRCRQVVLAVPDAEVMSKIIQLDDDLHDVEIEELITFEAEKHIPHPLDEINFDFELLGTAKKNPGLLDVLLVAVRAQNVNNRIEAVMRAGLNAVVVDVESFAVERAVRYLAPDLPGAGQGKTIAVVNLSADNSHLFIIHDLHLVYSRDEQFGREQLLVDDECTVRTSFKENILTQLRRTLHFFYSTSQEENIDHLLLAGDMACVPGLAQLVQEQLEIPTTVVNPFSQMTLGEGIVQEALNHDAPGLIVACGLALRAVA